MFAVAAFIGSLALPQKSIAAKTFWRARRRAG
jgi:hypothetical protein